MLRLVPEGSTIARAYLAIPGYYTLGEKEFPDTTEGWDRAVQAAKAKKQGLVDSLTKSFGPYGTPEEIERTANIQVRIDLRWKISYPEGGGVDTIVESYKDVDRLRTREEIGAKSG